MQLSVTSLTEPYARQLCQWRYEGPYALYNLSDWDTMVQEGVELANAAVRAEQFRAVTSEGELIGFFRMTPDGERHVELGLGLAPDRCDKGLGKELMALATQYAQTIHPGRRVFVEVRTFNLRAVHCYEKCGYFTLRKHRELQPKGEFDYYTMEYKS